jgi:hypothetical protein
MFEISLKPNESYINIGWRHFTETSISDGPINDFGGKEGWWDPITASASKS